MSITIVNEVWISNSPECPVCDGLTVEVVAQEVSKRKEGDRLWRLEAGVISYRCAAGHWHDGEAQIPGPPEDVQVVEARPR